MLKRRKYQCTGLSALPLYAAYPHRHVYPKPRICKTFNIHPCFQSLVFSHSYAVAGDTSPGQKITGATESTESTEGRPRGRTPSIVFRHLPPGRMSWTSAWSLPRGLSFAHALSVMVSNTLRTPLSGTCLLKEVCRNLNHCLEFGLVIVSFWRCWTIGRSTKWLFQQN